MKHFISILKVFYFETLQDISLQTYCQLIKNVFENQHFVGILVPNWPDYTSEYQIKLA